MKINNENNCKNKREKFCKFQKFDFIYRLYWKRNYTQDIINIGFTESIITTYT